MVAMSVILSAVLPVFITAFIGYAVARLDKPFDNKTVAFLVSSVGTPALVFFNLAKTPIVPAALIGMTAVEYVMRRDFSQLAGEILRRGTRADPAG